MPIMDLTEVTTVGTWSWSIVILSSVCRSHLYLFIWTHLSRLLHHSIWAASTRLLKLAQALSPRILTGSSIRSPRIFTTSFGNVYLILHLGLLSKLLLLVYQNNGYNEDTWLLSSVLVLPLLLLLGRVLLFACVISVLKNNYHWFKKCAVKSDSSIEESERLLEDDVVHASCSTNYHFLDINSYMKLFWVSDSNSLVELRLITYTLRTNLLTCAFLIISYEQDVAYCSRQ